MFHANPNNNSCTEQLPDKLQASLVNFYYMWKKNRGHVSLMQQQTNQSRTSKSVINSISENGNSNAKNTENGQSNEADVINLYVQVFLILKIIYVLHLYHGGGYGRVVLIHFLKNSSLVMVTSS